MMKKTLTVLLGMIIVFSLSVYMNTAKADKITVDLKSKGLSLISEVDTLAECEEFITLYTGSPEINEIVSDIGNGDYTEPKVVFIIENLDELVLKYVLQYVDLPSDVIKILKGKFAPILPSQLNSMNGSTALAATSTLYHQDSFIYEGLQNTVSYLYIFDNGYSFMVTFTPNDENIVNANVNVIMSEDLIKWATMDDAVDYFKNTLYFEDVSITMLTEEQ